MPNTAQEYDKVIDICQDIFVKKMQDYGTAWRILRPTSITDQIYIKANRIRSIEEKGITKGRHCSRIYRNHQLCHHGIDPTPTRTG